jgi:hypothetical protein
MNIHVTIEVRGGVAEVTQCAQGINVEIIDHDNLDEEARERAAAQRAAASQRDPDRGQPDPI